MKYKIVIEFESSNSEAIEVKNLIDMTVECCPILSQGVSVELIEDEDQE